MPLDAHTFESTVRTHGSRLHCWFRAVTYGSDQDVEDLVCRTFASVWAKRDRFDGNSIVPWLWGFARNEYRAYCRAAERGKEAIESFRREANDSVLAKLPDELLEEAQRRLPFVKGQVDDCLKQLRFADRRIIELYYGIERRAAGKEPALLDRDGKINRKTQDRSPGCERGSDSRKVSNDAGRPTGSTTWRIGANTDPEVGRFLSAELGETWKPGRVKMARRRALASLRECIKRLAGMARREEERESNSIGDHTMGGKRPGPDPPISAHQLLKLLEEADSKEREELIERLERSPSDREAVADLLALELALTSCAEESALAEETAGAEESARAKETGAAAEGSRAIDTLPEDLERRLLALTRSPEAQVPNEPAPPPHLALVRKTDPPDRLPDVRSSSAGDTDSLEATAKRGPPAAPRRWSPTWAPRALAAAALVLVCFGAWEALQRWESTHHLPDKPVWKGDDDPSVTPSEESPVSVWIHRPDAEEPVEILGRRIGRDAWQVSVPRDAIIQVRVMRAEDTSKAASWSASATLSRKHPDGTISPLPIPDLRGQGMSTDLDINLGRPIRVPALETYGLRPEDTLELEIQRGNHTFHLDILLLSP